MTTTRLEPAELPDEIVRFMETFELPPGETLAGFLHRYDDRMNAVTVPLPEMQEVTIAEVGGWRIRAAVWSPPATGVPVVLHIHGGGWAVGNHLTHRGLAAELVAAGFVVVSLDYRRAPKHRFPAAFDDCRLALEWCADRIGDYGGDPARIAIAGDSAGANLAAAVLVHDDSIARAGVLLSGIFEYHEALRALAGVLGAQAGDDLGYVRTADFEMVRGDPRLSPLCAAAHLPRSYIGVGDRDPLVDQSRRLRAALDEAAMPHVYDEIAGAPHNYVQLPGHPCYRDGIDRMVGFLHDIFGSATR